MYNSKIAEPTSAADTQPKFTFEVFYDGKCPLCRREISFLKAKDRKSRIRFRDIQQLQLNCPEIPRTHDLELKYLGDFTTRSGGLGLLPRHGGH